ncbi:conserved hypothetical protein [Neospora caninum Liverpool]|uniref:Dolichyl-diphosphooligosaccharide-protein glycosyltransferase subunit OST5 n=1 Tax=Neospora caninum (strain Liverpool) TaxID=572307 RepID=F0VQI5_NEOCL|nr:conserved hypothetical protein [Neospora caninum Liverpool]CBZ55982.1 conserved hypothetical protein [Neospora caninum Liverpool]CEL70728.1 TPA: UPF0197 transmembrane protein CG9669 [Neospora caninum Liverpool]|eukprot:XP_003886008.1 conserved hypothetical protein [Neospora caninum Liverpool]
MACTMLFPFVFSFFVVPAAASPVSPHAPLLASAAQYVPFPIFIAPRLFEGISLVLLFLGLVISASFIIFHIRYSARERSLAKEILWSAVASLFLGFAVAFLLLSSGVYY